MTEVVRLASSERPSELHVGVVVTSWNPEITDRLLDAALSRLENLGVGRVTVLRVPGSLELPVGASQLAKAGCDAVVALGVIVKGETDHYTIVATESSRGIAQVSLDAGIPVANGILAVHDISQAVDRARPGASNKGYEAAEAAVSAALALGALAEGRSPA